MNIECISDSAGATVLQVESYPDLLNRIFITACYIILVLALESQCKGSNVFQKFGVRVRNDEARPLVWGLCFVFPSVL